MMHTYARCLGLAGATLLLGACSTPQVQGEWRPIAAPLLYFDRVELPTSAVDKGWPELCHEAREEIDKQLAHRLPARLQPLPVRRSAAEPDMGAAQLRLRIEDCEVDSEQSGGSFRFYLTLRVQLRFTDDGQTPLRHTMTVYEQAQSSTPSPLFEFTFIDAVRQTLMLFDGARVLRPHTP